MLVVSRLGFLHRFTYGDHAVDRLRISLVYFILCSLISVFGSQLDENAVIGFMSFIYTKIFPFCCFASLILVLWGAILVVLRREDYDSLGDQGIPST